MTAPKEPSPTRDESTSNERNVPFGDGDDGDDTIFPYVADRWNLQHSAHFFGFTS